MKNAVPILTLCLLILSACEKHQDAPPDPCADAKPFKADFYIQEQVGDSLIKTDKVMQYGFVVFEAADIYSSYTWTIGDDARTFTDRKVSLLFTDSIERVDVQLIATKKPGACFANDRTTDTVTKSFSVIPWRECPLLGSFAGSFQSTPSWKDTVKIVLVPQPDGWHSIRLLNINRGCNLDTALTWGVSRGAYAYHMENTGTMYNGCKSPDAWLRLQGTDTLVADYTYTDNSAGGNNAAVWPRVRDKFVGVRIK